MFKVSKFIKERGINMAIIMDGKALSKKIREQLKIEVENLNKKNIFPKLAVIMVGENPASKVYVKNKSKACNEVGIQYEEFMLAENINMEELLKLIKELTEFESLENTKHLPRDMKSTLVQINIADDYFKAKAQVEKLERDMELKDRELYDLKHDLISNQLKTESADDRIKELEAENRELLLNKARLEATLEDALLEGIGSKKTKK